MPMDKTDMNTPQENENVDPVNVPSEFKNDPKEKEKETPKNDEPNSEEKGKETPKNEEEEEKKKKYNLEEVVEYSELLEKYNALQNDYSNLQQAKADLDGELTSLREFKLGAERQQKQAMIDSFYMLSETDKKDVVEHIDTYSLDDIEAKLSIACVRNKVNFNLDSNNSENQDNSPKMFSLNSAAEQNSAPDWIIALRETAKGSN